MQRGEVDMCIVGTDRTLATGDVCNKIGTYLKALAAQDNNVPFYVALPSSTIDWEIEDFKDIPIAERNSEELSHVQGLDENNNVKIVTEIGSYDLMGKPADEFPATPELNKRLDVGIDANILSEMISTVSFAVSKDDLKPALTGVYFKFEKESLTAVATDGHRLAKYVRSDFKAGEFQGEVIVPRKFLNIINSYISKDETTQLLLGDSVFTATIGADTIYTRIIDERFPDYQSVIPTDNEKEIRASCDELLSAVKRVSIFSNKATHQIAIRASNGSATITTEDPEKEIGRAHV